jgi:hypothetical protein
MCVGSQMCKKMRIEGGRERERETEREREREEDAIN